VLKVCRCRNCRLWIHPPAPVCYRCRSTDLGFEQVSGRGTVATFTVNHQRWSAGASTDPYVVAIVELDEQPGLRLISNVVDCPVADVAIGQRVRVTFRPLEDVWLPLFAPDAGG
jgi:uncharacterized OB-fold protein